MKKSLLLVLLLVALTEQPIVLAQDSNSHSESINNKVCFKDENTLKKMYIVQDGKEDLIGSISISDHTVFSVFLSPVLFSMKSTLPKSVSDIIEVVAFISKRRESDVKKTVLLGDLYIAPAYRGKGYAQLLVKNTCQECFQKGYDFIALIPDPFEYENGVQKSLHDMPEYDAKQKALIKLYTKCGFKIASDQHANFMYQEKCPFKTNL
jgi:GNAT superfamily N-acetyltransferase